MERWLETWRMLLREDGLATLGGLGLIAVFTLLELARPAERPQRWSGRARNLVFLLQYKLLGLAAFGLWLAWGPAPRSFGLDTSAIAAPLLVLANLFVIDFFYYWYHRAQHRFRPLWAIHELHHSDTELNATTSYRTYWLEILAQGILVSGPTALFFGHLGGAHFTAVLAASVFLLIFTHCNLRLPFGRASLLVCGPQVHRIHHSRLPEHRDRNFAQFFPVLDRLFGTWHAPARDEYPPTGAEELPGDASLSRVLGRPFEIWGESLGLRPALAGGEGGRRSGARRSRGRDARRAADRARRNRGKRGAGRGKKRRR